MTSYTLVHSCLQTCLGLLRGLGAISYTTWRMLLHDLHESFYILIPDVEKRAAVALALELNFELRVAEAIQIRRSYFPMDTAKEGGTVRRDTGRC